MNVYESSLRKIFDNMEGIENNYYTGRSCIADLGGGKVMKAYLVSSDMGRYKDALTVSILSKDKGTIDAEVFRFKDVWPQRYNICGNKEAPHIGTYNGIDQWYTPEPSIDDYIKLSEKVSNYVGFFSEVNMDQTEGMSGIGM